MENNITVAVPTRNSEWCLNYALKSLEKQTFLPKEIIICVGKSEDKTEKIVLDFQKRSKVPVRVIYDMEGIGTGYARKRLVEETRTKLIYWLDSDDILQSDMLENVNYLFNKYKLDTLAIDVNYVDHKVWLSDYWDTYLSSPLYFKNNHSKKKLSVVKHKRKNLFSIVNRVEVLLRAGNFDPYFVRGQDLDMQIRLRRLNVKMAICPEIRLTTAGVVGTDKFKKLLTKPTFLKFIYKYGLEYILFYKYHAIGFVLRILLPFSLTMFFLFGLFNIYSGLLMFKIIFTISSTSLIFGLIYARYKNMAYDTLPFKSVLLMQFCKCIAEYYQIYKFITDKNKPNGFKYGEEYIKK